MSSNTDAPPASMATQAVAAALKETLQRTGDLDDVRARLRAAVLRNMNEALGGTPSSAAAPDIPIETVLLNELVADYLSFSGFDQTLSVFAAESRAESGGKLGEAFIRAELGLSRTSSSLALLYEIVEAMKARRKRRQVGP